MYVDDSGLKALKPAPDLEGLLAILSKLGIETDPGYTIVRESEYHWAFEPQCRYGAAPVDVCLYTSHHGDGVDDDTKAVLYIAVGDDAGTWVGDIRWRDGKWQVAEMHIDRLVFGRM